MVEGLSFVNFKIKTLMASELDFNFSKCEIWLKMTAHICRFWLIMPETNVTDCWPKWEPKKFLPFRFTFFSTSVTTARTLLRILAYFFLQIGNFFWRFRKIGKKIILGVFWCIFRYMKVLCEKGGKTTLKGTYMVKNMPSRCLQNPWNYFFWILLEK